MRTIKSIILTSASLKSANVQNLSEEQIVLRAIVDVNLPKLLDEDIATFNAICSDLFSGIELPKARPPLMPP